MTMDFNRRSAMVALTFGTALPIVGCLRDDDHADLAVINARVNTMSAVAPVAQAFATRGGRITSVGSNEKIKHVTGSRTRIIDAGGRSVIPGLNDSHHHFVRGSLSYDLDVRWDGVPTLRDALAKLARQAAKTPSGQWVRVGGGWSEFQFAEKRVPTLDELNTAVPDKPAYVLHFYSSAMINRAGLAALGMGRNAKPLPGGLIERDATGVPTGMLLARPLPATVLAPEAHMPVLTGAAAEASVRRYARELNRLGLTSIIDPGGAGQTYPDFYRALFAIRKVDDLGVRLGMYLVPQRPGQEVEDFAKMTRSIHVLGDEHRFRFVGGGEMLLQSMQDWDLYTVPPVTIPHAVEPSLVAAIETLSKAGWYMRQHATFDATANLYMDAIEAAMHNAPFRRSRWILDHAELATPATLERVKRLGGGIAIQHRAAFHGELGVANFGSAEISEAPPVRRMLELGIPVGAGTDATRDTTYNPWVCIEWLVSGRTVGGTKLRADDDLIDVATAIRLYTVGSAWFSGEEDVKGTLAPGMLADFAVLNQDPLAVPTNRLHLTESLLTVMDGRVVHAADPFNHLAPPPIPAAADWSPNGFEPTTTT